MEKTSQKIVIVGPAYPYRGGIAAFSERLAREFVSLGDDVELVTFTLQYPGFLFPGKTQFSEGPAPEGLKTTRLLNSCNPFNWIRTGRKIRKGGADIVVFAFWMPFMGPALGTVARIVGKGGATRVGLVHNLVPHEPKPGEKLLSRYFCKSMDRFVTMSDSVLKDIRGFCPQKPAQMCPHPLYDQYGEAVGRGKAVARLGLDPSKRYLLFFGLIREYKGLDWLLEAMADSRMKAMDNVRLLVAGEFYGDSARYYELAEPLGERVIWRAEFIPDEDIRYYFGAADIIVQPYKSATQSGVSQIAYHFDKPMVVTRVGGLPEIVPDGKAGYAVEPSPTGVADALVDFFSNGRDFSVGLAEEKKKYSWEKMAQTVVG